MIQAFHAVRGSAVQGVVVLVGDHRGFSSDDIAGYEKDGRLQFVNSSMSIVSSES